MSLQKYSSDELFEFRKQLLDWKIGGPKTILTVISLLQNAQLEKSEIIKSKLYKTVKVVRQQMLKGVQKDNQLYNNDQLEMINLKLGNIYRELVDIIGPRKRSLEIQSKVHKETNDQPSNKTNDSEIKEIRYKYSKIERDDFRQKLVKTATKLKDDYFTKYPELIATYQLTDKNIEEKIAQVIEKIEDLLYIKNINYNDCFWRYQEDLKTLAFVKQTFQLNIFFIKYFKKDQTGNVFAKLIAGIFPVQEAAKLKLEDWVDEKKTRMSNQEQILLDDNYQKQIRLQIMSESQGQECPKCKEQLFYLVEVKQIRKADDPSTKFYECFACSFRTKNQ